MMKTITRTDERILSADVFGRDAQQAREDLGFWQEDAQNIPIYRRCQVLVVGGGPSGTAAAAAAAKQGADVVLLERYNHLGGLSTGGLVIWIDRMTDWQGELVIRGFAKELFDRLPADAVAGPAPADWGSQDADTAKHWSFRTAAYHGIVTWSPTIDPERLKLLSQQILLERQVKLVYHSWVAAPLMKDGALKGVAFESKEGRMAILADVVIDATGDGDLFARAGAAFTNDIEEEDVHHCMNTSWMFAGVDMNRWIAFRAQQPEAYSDFMQKGREACHDHEGWYTVRVQGKPSRSLMRWNQRKGQEQMDSGQHSPLLIRLPRQGGRAFGGICSSSLLSCFRCVVVEPTKAKGGRLIPK